jgi:peptide/nickel transport system ATP-binding protein
LYRGSVAEAGDVDLVVQQPRHPYTQLLIKSVPEPNPEHRWGDVEIRTDVGEVADGAAQVATRVPVGLLPASAGASAAACFLYRDQGTALALEQLNEVMRAAGSSTRSG